MLRTGKPAGLATPDPSNSVFLHSCQALTPETASSTHYFFQQSHRADAGDAAGIFVFDTASIEEARKWCDTDPAIHAGRFQVKLWKWYSAKGIGILPQSK